MSFVGRRNAYVCDVCRTAIVTVDRDDGTTPFIIACRSDSLLRPCRGLMKSQMYAGPIVSGAVPAGWEWRRPTPEEYKKANLAMRQHFDWGGLDLHRITQ